MSTKEPSRPIRTVQDGSNTMMILLGWAGCRDRYLSKYSQYYEKAGYSTIRFTVPISKVRSFDTYHHFAGKFHDWIEKEGGINEKNIYFHMFSMNGCSLYTALWDHWTKVENGKDMKAKVQGIIFDSSPADTTPYQSAHAISYATLPPSHYHSFLRESYRALLLAYLSAFRGMMWIRSFVDKEIYEKNLAYFRLFAFDDMPTQQLYLFGPGDEVCSEESIEAFAREMERRGIEPIRVIMKDSAHCQHYRTYPLEYTNACINFIEKKVDSNKESEQEKIDNKA